LNLLFICSRNRIRSLAAESLFAGDQRFQVRSAGTAEGARIRVTAGHVRWAEIIFVMEPKHRKHLNRRFSEEMRGKQVICLFVPDEYELGDPELDAHLESKLAEFLD
jgi:predicted protein tyrosine phosphatase